MEWNYENINGDETGYGEYLYDLEHKYSNKEFILKSENEQQEMIEEVFSIYRQKNIFPTTYYDANGIRKEIEKCINKNFNFEGDVLDFKYNQGLSLLKFLFPNSNKVIIGTDNRTMENKFANDHTLKRAVKFALKYDKNAKPSKVLGGLRMIGGSTTTNFKPMIAKALYERYCPIGGVIYDFSCGFGGRMLGALSSKNNYKYIGVEPNTETYKNLLKLGQYIEEVTSRKNSYEIINSGSEDYLGELESVDFAFSSPPYFNLEKYCEEDTQCYIKFPTLDEWLEGYVRPTIRNTYKMLKQDGIYAVNIADFKYNNKMVQFVDSWIQIAEEEGFAYKEQLYMSIQSRRKDAHKKDGEVIQRKEGIFIFNKIK